MARDYDAVTKELTEYRPADGMHLLGLPKPRRVEVIDADVSKVSAAADKVVRVTGPVRYIYHREFQASLDNDLPGPFLD